MKPGSMICLGQRDRRESESLMAQQRFNVALAQISQMQLALLESEERRREMETGIEVIQATLRRTMKDRDGALGQVLALNEQLNDGGLLDVGKPGFESESNVTVDFLTEALSNTAQQRDTQIAIAAKAESDIRELEFRA